MLRYRFIKVDCDGTLNPVETGSCESETRLMADLMTRKVTVVGDMVYVGDFYFEQLPDGLWAKVDPSDPRLVGLYGKIVRYEAAQASYKRGREW